MIKTNEQESRSVFRRPVWIAAGPALLLILLGFWLGYSLRRAGAPAVPAVAAPVGAAAARAGAGGSTNIYAHNLRLHQGPSFRVYVQWLRGQLQPSRQGVNPSFDDPESFYLNVTNGVIRANMGDICNYLNAKSSGAPLSGITMAGVGDQIKITGKLHKGLTIPVELTGTLTPAPPSSLRMHVTKIDVLKIPLKGLLGGFNFTLSDMVGSAKIEGVEVSGNDILFDAGKLLPPPHIRGSLTAISLGSPDLQVVYGDVAKDVETVQEWRNFLRMRNGTLDFGKLTMHNVDLMMIDISPDAWFDLDLANYQEQLVKGYTRMTPQAGLQIFMPDLSDLEKKTAKTSVDIEWFKNRNQDPPADVVPK